MSKGKKKIFMICAIVFAVGCVMGIAGLVAGGISGLNRLADKYSWFVGPDETIRTVYLDTQDASPASDDQLFDRIRIEGDADVNVCVGEVDRTRVTCGKSYQQPEMYISKGVLYIKSQISDDAVINLSGDAQYPDVVVCCPENWTIREIDADTSFGDLDIAGIKLKNADINSSSGDVCMENSSFGKAEITTDSGDVDIERAEGSRMNIESGTGDVSADSLTCRIMDISTLSGNVSCDGLKTGELNVSSGSGECSIEGELKGDTMVKAESGDVDIVTTLKKSEYELVTNVESGELNIENTDGTEIRNDGSRKYVIKAELGIGDLNISFR